MIFYFSGTGNSLYVAKNIGQYNNEKLVSIAKEMKRTDNYYEYDLKENEVIGFIYPIYAWSPPKMVIDFIQKLKFNNYKDNYIFTVATCGENIGNTIKVLDSVLRKKNLSLKSGFSISMPNNYIILGDVDTKEVENSKLIKAEERLEYINKIIKNKKEGIYEVEKGPIPRLLTAIVNPLFNKMNMSTKRFYADDKCIGCGLCENVCNTNTISVKGKPIWGKECTQCLACINLCPVQAIQYGKNTKSKGRYQNSNIDIADMRIFKKGTKNL